MKTKLEKLAIFSIVFCLIVYALNGVVQLIFPGSAFIGKIENQTFFIYLFDEKVFKMVEPPLFFFKLIVEISIFPAFAGFTFGLFYFYFKKAVPAIQKFNEDVKRLKSKYR